MLRCGMFLLIASFLLVSAASSAETDKVVLVDLQTAAQLALKVNPRLHGADAMVDVSKAGIEKARSARYPTLAIESSYSYLSKETIFGSTPVMEENTQINRVAAGQVLYSGGAVQAGARSAAQGYLAASHTRQAMRADVLASVAEAYFRARQAAEVVAITQASKKSLAASYDAAQKLRESGVVTNTDVLRAQVALTSARSDVIEARNNSEVALAALRSAIGLRQEHPIDLRPDASDTAPEHAGTTAVARRPELAAAEAAVNATKAQISAAKAGRQPTIALFADYYNQPTGAQFPRLSDTIMAGVMLKFNVFDGGLTRANIDEADAAFAKARDDLESQARQVEFEQKRALLDLNSAKSRVDATATQVQSAEESLRALQVGYKEGMTPLTDVLSAETALTSARVMRLAALYDVKMAEVKLLRAYGQTDVLAK